MQWTSVPRSHTRALPLIQPGGGTALFASLDIPLPLPEHRLVRAFMLSVASGASQGEGGRSTQDILMPSGVRQDLITTDQMLDNTRNDYVVTVGVPRWRASKLQPARDDLKSAQHRLLNGLVGAVSSNGKKLFVHHVGRSRHQT